MNDKVRVVGISQDAVEKQKQFVEQHKLPVRLTFDGGCRIVPSLVQYPVLSDSNGEARKAYHVGKGLLGLVEGRVTFIIDKDGMLRCVLCAFCRMINTNGGVKPSDAFESTMNYRCVPYFC